MDQPHRFFHIGAPGAWLSVHGADAFRFLQNQFSNDIDRAAVRPATYGLWLDRKGKIEADSHVLRLGPDRFLVYAAYSPGEALRERLERYVIADDVVVSNLGEGARVCSAFGSGVPEAAGMEPPGDGCFETARDCHLFAGRRGPQPQFEIVGPAGNVQEMAERLLAEGFAEADAGAVESARIAAGLPAVPADAGPGELPQEAGLESVAVSFTKGCFLGQEVVAKVRQSGGYRRRLYRVSGVEPCPAPGDRLFQGERLAGWVRSVARKEPGWIGIALVKHRELDPEGEVRTGAARVQIEAPV